MKSNMSIKVKLRFYTRINEKDCVETCCIVMFKDDRGEGNFFGNSVQHPNDTNVEYIGRKVALKRTLESVMGKRYRTEIWKYFHKHYKDVTL